MYRKAYIYTIAIIFIVFAIVYYVVSFGDSINTVFLTISTFLFAIFTGFFISRQGIRYSSIRDSITTFDGNMSFLYRAVGHFGGAYEKEAATILTNYYEEILEKKAWDYELTHKTNILTSFQKLLSHITKNEELSGSDNMVLNRMVEALRTAQVARKQLIALYQERIPQVQWVLIYFLGFILLVTLSGIPSVEILSGALLKSAFATSIIFVTILLHQFDRLRFFEGTMGERSAQDVLDIIAGEK